MEDGRWTRETRNIEDKRLRRLEVEMKRDGGQRSEDPG
jgi:hypothetical protein